MPDNFYAKFLLALQSAPAGVTVLLAHKVKPQKKLPKLRGGRIIPVTPNSFRPQKTAKNRKKNKRQIPTVWVKRLLGIRKKRPSKKQERLIRFFSKGDAGQLPKSPYGSFIILKKIYGTGGGGFVR